MARKTTRLGRPKGPERSPLSLRVTPEVRMKLDQAAAQTGRSISQEAELRLERSFDRQDLLCESASYAFGPRLAGTLLAVGKAVALLGPLQKFAVTMSKDGALIEQGRWDHDEVARQNSAKVADLIFRILINPESEDAASFRLYPMPLRLIDRHGERIATVVWMIVNGIAGRHGQEFEHEWRPIRELLGPVAEKLSAHATKQETQDGHGP